MSKIGHSAKNCTRQTRTLGKWLLCRVPDSRQNLYTRHRLPVKTASGHGLLCRAPAVRHSAKIWFFLKFLCRVPPDLALGKDLNFFKKNSLPSVSDLALGKEFFFIFKILCRVPLDGTRQRFNFFLLFLCRVLLWMHSAKRKFKKKLKHSLPSAWWLALGKDTLCRVPCPGTRQSFFVFFVFGLQFFVQPF